MNIFIYLVVITICCASSCKKNNFFEGAYRIRVQNNTNVTIAYLVSYSYPDTIIPDQYNNLSGIQKMDYTPFDSKVEWDKVFTEKKASKISFFFFSPDTIAKYGWDNVRSGYRVLMRKDFTLKELQNTNYKVTYP